MKTASFGFLVIKMSKYRLYA